MKKHLAFALLLAACTDAATGGPDAGTDPDATDGRRTLDTCTTSVAADAPAFYQRYFACSTITAAADGTVTIASQDLPPHDSYYYPDGDPNHIAFDTQGNTHFANPNRLSAQSVSLAIPANPIAKGITITADMVDETANTSAEEYPLGTVGVALDSVSIYTGTAGPGDDINQEQYTFDTYDAHPSPDGAYHYHAPTPGPLEVLTARGEAGTLYGILCDGTVVLGCDELDGSTPGTLDAQGGHLGDITAADGTTFFSNRYHVHVCATGRPFTPEIQYYTTCAR